MPELVTHGENGLLFEPGNEADLAAQISRVVANPTQMRSGARQSFEEKFTAERNYPALMTIYETARKRAANRTKNSEGSYRASPPARPLSVGTSVGSPTPAAVGSQGAG
jgi:hypothetical protein